MTLSAAVGMITVSGFGLIFAQVLPPHDVNFNIAKEYTLSGLLVIGILFLYRELKRTREEAETKDEKYQASLERLTSASVASLKENTEATERLTLAIDKQNKFYETLVQDAVKERMKGK